MSNIEKAFEKGKACIAFFTCGDPNLETTAAAVRAAVANGADLIELGIPFSDPTAEGPIIQGANLRALAGGVTTDKVFEMVRGLRKDLSVPIVFVTYANVVYSFGAENFIASCGDIGINGLLVPDLPFEERAEFDPYCRKYDIDLIAVVAPTSGKRITMIAEEASGFIYLLTPGLTKENLRSRIGDLEEIMKEIRTCTKAAVAVGSSSMDPEVIQALGNMADGFIMESEMVKMIATEGEEVFTLIGDSVAKVKAML